IKPIAPFADLAEQSKFDSAATMLWTNTAGTLCFAAAAAIRPRVSDFGKNGGCCGGAFVTTVSVGADGAGNWAWGTKDPSRSMAWRIRGIWTMEASASLCGDCTANLTNAEQPRNRAIAANLILCRYSGVLDSSIKVANYEVATTERRLAAQHYSGEQMHMRSTGIVFRISRHRRMLCKSYVATYLRE